MISSAKGKLLHWFRFSELEKSFGRIPRIPQPCSSECHKEAAARWRDIPDFRFCRHSTLYMVAVWEYNCWSRLTISAEPCRNQRFQLQIEMLLIKMSSRHCQKIATTVLMIFHGIMQKTRKVSPKLPRKRRPPGSLKDGSAKKNTSFFFCSKIWSSSDLLSSTWCSSELHGREIWLAWFKKVHRSRWGNVSQSNQGSAMGEWVPGVRSIFSFDMGKYSLESQLPLLLPQRLLLSLRWSKIQDTVLRWSRVPGTRRRSYQRKIWMLSALVYSIG